MERRLGYPGLSGESPTGERFNFWEAARADGAMITGTRLYDHSSALSIDYGWTAEDVEWEIDFTAPEFGCARAMLCDEAHGYVVGLRRSLDWRDLVQSFADNGFDEQLSTPGLWSTDRTDQPFTDVLLIPQLGAIASGNSLGIRRIADVVGGAPSLRPVVDELADALGPVESAYLDADGCVTLGEAMGPDATSDDVAEYFKKNDPSNLAEPDGWAVGIAGADRASAVVSVPITATREDTVQRHEIVNAWPSLQRGIPMSDVATAEATAGTPERFDFAVAQMPAFVSMVLTHDAPWAMCPAQPPA